MISAPFNATNRGYPETLLPFTMPGNIIHLKQSVVTSIGGTQDIIADDVRPLQNPHEM